MVKILTTSIKVNNTDNKAIPLNGSHDVWSRNKHNTKQMVVYNSSTECKTK